jgi:HK97 family phage major capsid protein
MAKVAELSGDIKRAELMEEADRHASELKSALNAGADNAAEAPFASLGDQLMAVRTAALSGGNRVDPRLLRINEAYAAALGASESVPSDGGFLVAPEFSSQIFEHIYETGEITSRCTQQPMSSNRLVLPAVDEDSRADLQRWGGVLAFWEGEAGSYTGTKPKFRTMELIANKLTALVYLTEELSEDAPALAAYCNRIVPQEVQFKFDDAVLNGPGAGMPLGILTSLAPFAVTRDSAGLVKTDDVLSMWQHCWGASRKNGVWLINQDVEAQLYALAFQNPTGAVLFQAPMYTPPGERGNNTPYGLLMGRPVIPVEQCAALSTQGDIILADLSQYVLGKKGGIRADQSIHVAFLTGEVAFRWMIRASGQPQWKKPITPYKGTTQLSPFTVLTTK